MKKTAWSLSVALLVAAAMSPGKASSHREAPLIAVDPAADNTDVYAFVSPDRPGHGHADRQLHPVPGAGRRPELLPVRRHVLYEIHVDNNGDAVEDITYQCRFTTELPQPAHVPLQHRADHVARRPD